MRFFRQKCLEKRMDIAQSIFSSQEKVKITAKPSAKIRRVVASVPRSTSRK
jgi:hypothetical protein